MQRAVAVELEQLAHTLLLRKWAARAGLVTEGGEVLALRGLAHESREALREATEASEPSSRAVDEGEDPGDEALPEGLVAHIVVESVDEHRWIYADVGSVRLLVRLSATAHESEATEWLTQALKHRGISVEHEPAQRE